MTMKIAKFTDIDKGVPFSGTSVLFGNQIKKPGLLLYTLQIIFTKFILLWKENHRQNGPKELSRIIVMTEPLFFKWLQIG